jgi:hypothetical protein
MLPDIVDEGSPIDEKNRGAAGLYEIARWSRRANTKV